MASLTTPFICILSKAFKKNLNTAQIRSIVTKESGGILGAPEKKGMRGIVGVALGVGTGITIGSALSRDVANFLEEHDLFVPDAEDDNNGNH